MKAEVAGMGASRVLLCFFLVAGEEGVERTGNRRSPVTFWIPPLPTVSHLPVSEITRQVCVTRLLDSHQ